MLGFLAVCRRKSSSPVFWFDTFLGDNQSSGSSWIRFENMTATEPSVY